MARYVALLRGINVGGKNLIGMPALKASFEAEGFEDVVTYIQSGNVLFRAARSGSAAMEARIEAMLARSFTTYAASVVVRSHGQMRAVVEDAPPGFGTDPKKYRYDVAFLKGSVTARSAAKQVPTKPEVDELHAGRGVLYMRRLDSRATQSRLNRIASLPIYKDMTLRNWNTTTTLLRMLDELAER